MFDLVVDPILNIKKPLQLPGSLMKQDDFDQLATAIDALSPNQRHQLLERLLHPETIPAIVAHLEQHLQSHLRCPKCSQDQIYRWGTLKGLQRYRCRGCHKTFTALTDTPLARLRKRELWMEYAQSMLNSEVLRTAAARCRIHLTTAFLWRHRFLKLADYLNANELTGIVEADQTMFRESFKGQRKVTKRPVRKRGNDNKRDAKWVPVLVARGRSAGEADFVLEHFTLKNVVQHLLPLLSRDIVLCTDGHLTFEVFTGKHHLKHQVRRRKSEGVGIPYTGGEQLSSAPQRMDPTFPRCRHQISTSLSRLVPMV